MISAWDCLYFAAVELVHSTPIKQRIVNAYRRYLSLMPAEQLPVEIRDSYTQILQSLHGVQPLRGEDEVTASVRKMSNQEADDCAALILGIFAQLCRSQIAQGRPSAEVVMLHSPDSPPKEFETPSSIARA